MSVEATPIVSALEEEVTRVSYVTVISADNYFDYHLGKITWNDASISEKEIALLMATSDIDRLSFKGELTEDDQENSFPRDGETTIPQAIFDACCEQALKLIEGYDVDKAMEGQRVLSRKYGPVSTTYDKDTTLPWISAGILSKRAWDMLAPYLKSTTKSLLLTRAS